MAIVFDPGLLESIDADIRAGRQAKARKDLTDLCRATVPREHRLRVGALSRRAGLPYLSLRLLAPHVRPAGKKIGDATPEEKAEYAAGLIYVGASGEALEILSSLGKAPTEAALFTAFALFAQWEYARAIPVLSEYVRAGGLTDYQRLVGNVNLAAALVTERHSDDAAKLLSAIEKQSREGQSQLLHGVILLLSAQNHVFQKNWAEADRYLELAQEDLKNSESLEALFVRKWKAIASLLRKQADGDRNMLAIRDEAVRRGHGETVRDIDRFLALHHRDESLFIHVYYGTPYDSFRRRLKSDADFRVDLPPVYSLKLGEGWDPPVSVDVARGEASDGRKPLKFGGHVHLLLKEFCHDFYQSSSLTALHARVYEGEYFNPISTPAKMHRLMVRLREWLEGENIPLRIEEKRSNYRLVGEAPCWLTVKERTLTSSHPQLDQLQSKFADDKFSVKEASRCLDAPSRTVLRLLEKGMSDGRLTREGKASATRYHFLKKAG